MPDLSENPIRRKFDRWLLLAGPALIFLTFGLVIVAGQFVASP